MRVRFFNMAVDHFTRAEDGQKKSINYPFLLKLNEIDSDMVHVHHSLLIPNNLDSISFEVRVTDSPPRAVQRSSMGKLFPT